ncbi:YciI family protein [Saccharopolyspora sp. K220]|uniref:YciI family protein n=1 Tax=Saccharopolyspora soli TaxID=2926618 RepID=UPI001F599DFC|nr:YciI family protein [Saccharopolyspora soli]MCI2418550.1 YciI family protein [Saccharopolyspora soli]
MRFLMMVKANADSEAGVMPSEAAIKEMTDYNEELVNAGVLLAGEGLHPSSKGFRTEIGTGGGRTVVDGPFAETKELIAGFWLLQVRSREEMVEWAKRCPEPVEVRQLFDAEDFADVIAPEDAERERRLAEEVRGYGGIG